MNVFTAPAGAVLAADTEYELVLEGAGVKDVGPFAASNVRISSTVSHAEDPGSAAGWSIENGSRFNGSLKNYVYPISVHGSEVFGSAATGQPAITGTAEVGQTLTAGKGTIADVDGTTKADNNDVGFAYTYQWVQVDGSSETDITGATDSTYTLATEDAGKTVKVKVSFTDDADNAEGPLTSEPYPASGTVVASDAPIWATTLTIGDNGSGSRGYTSDSNTGFLEDPDFEYGSSTVSVEVVAASTVGVAFRTDTGGATLERLVLEWADEVLPLNEAQRSGNSFFWNQPWLKRNASSLTSPGSALPAGHSGVVCLRASSQICPSTTLTDPATATGQPAITGTAQVGRTLTAGKGTIADENGTTQADNGATGYAYTYQWVRVNGLSETDITNATAGTYTLAAEDAGKTVKVKVSFTDDAGFAEGPLVSEAYPATGTIVARNVTTALVSNTGQPLSATTYLLGGQGKRYAQEFRTGANAGGYHLETVGVYIDSISSSPGVSFTVSGLHRGCRRLPRYPGVHADVPEQLHRFCGEHVYRA